MRWSARWTMPRASWGSTRGSCASATSSAPDQFPYTTAAGETYDVGDFARVIDRVAEVADRAGFEARREASRAKGRLRGLGLCYYIESILGSPEEEVTVEFRDDGTAAIYVGTQSNGQGHETVFAPVPGRPDRHPAREDRGGPGRQRPHRRGRRNRRLAHGHGAEQRHAGRRGDHGEGLCRVPGGRAGRGARRDPLRRRAVPGRGLERQPDDAGGGRDGAQRRAARTC